MPTATPALWVAIATLPLAITLTATDARAQYATGFESLEVVPTLVPFAPDLWDVTQPGGTPGQDNYYLPAGTTSAPFQAQIYTAGAVLPGFNDYGIPDNPNGGNQFVVGNGPAGGTFARAQRDMSYPTPTCGADRWVWATDMCVTFAGTLPTAQNVGSFSVQPYPGSQSYIMLARWTDITTALNWNADYIWFDAAGMALTESVADPAFQNLAVNNWYRWETVGNLTTNAIEEVRIIDLSTGISTSFAPVGRYMEGGIAGSTRPTGFRLFAGGGVAGNVIAYDNTAILPAGDVTVLDACGANPANSLTVTATPTWPILGSTLALDVDAPAGTVSAGSIGGVFLSLNGAPTLPCGTPLPAPFLGNALIGAPIGTSIISLTPWAGPGSPVSMSFPVSNNPGVAGLCIYIQGVLIDFSTGQIQLTTGAEVKVGS